VWSTDMTQMREGVALTMSEKCQVGGGTNAVGPHGTPRAGAAVTGDLILAQATTYSKRTGKHSARVTEAMLSRQ
jgi:hypothetical protein